MNGLPALPTASEKSAAAAWNFSFACATSPFNSSARASESSLRPEIIERRAATAGEKESAAMAPSTGIAISNAMPSRFGQRR